MRGTPLTAKFVPVAPNERVEDVLAAVIEATGEEVALRPHIALRRRAAASERGVDARNAAHGEVRPRRTRRLKCLPLDEPARGRPPREIAELLEKARAPRRVQRRRERVVQRERAGITGRLI